MSIQSMNNSCACLRHKLHSINFWNLTAFQQVKKPLDLCIWQPITIAYQKQSGQAMTSFMHWLFQMVAVSGVLECVKAVTRHPHQSSSWQSESSRAIAVVLPPRHHALHNEAIGMWNDMTMMIDYFMTNSMLVWCVAYVSPFSFTPKKIHQGSATSTT